MSLHIHLQVPINNSLLFNRYMALNLPFTHLATSIKHFTQTFPCGQTHRSSTFTTDKNVYIIYPPASPASPFLLSPPK